jgi:hypothetical protein
MFLDWGTRKYAGRIVAFAFISGVSVFALPNTSYVALGGNFL